MKDPVNVKPPRIRATAQSSVVEILVHEGKDAQGETREFLESIDESINRIFTGLFGLAHDINDVTIHNINHLDSDDACDPVRRTNTFVSNQLESIQLRLNTFEARLNDVRRFVNI